MVRPNIDLTNSVSGGVRDIEDQYGLSRTEAYALVLRLGLREIGHEDFTDFTPDPTIVPPDTSDTPKSPDGESEIED